MHGERHPVDAEALLAHGEFVRALARRLVFDEGRVDDVVQETWLAAIEHAPARPRSLRAWLARVARNIAFKAARAESRRKRREEHGSEPRPPEPPPDAVDRLARGRQVVDAVLDLEEPYRTTVVLRFYEDLEPKEIARRLGLNGATVRTRLKRGLDMLRARLDRDAGGRRAWCLALLPVLVPHGNHVTGGVLLMSAKSKLSIAAVLLLAAAVGLLTVWSTGRRGTTRAVPTAAAHGPAAGSEGAPGTGSGADVPASALRVVVRVEDEAGHPLSGALVEAHRSFMPEIGIGYSSDDNFYAGATPSRPVAAGTTDATGIAVFLHDAGLALVYRATKEGYAQEDSGWVVLREGIEPDPVTLRLGPACPLSGVVFDDEGKPVAGAPVLAADPAWGASPWDMRVPWRTVSDPDGAYLFDDLPPRDVSVWAALPGGVPLRVATLRFPHLGKFDIVLEPGGVVTGTVTDAGTGEPMDGVRVRGTGMDHQRAEAYTDAQGRYEIRTLPATYVSTIRFRKDGYCQVFDGDEDGRVGLHLGRGDSLRVDARMRPAPVVRGTVHGPDGPLGGVPVQFSGRQPRYGTLFQTRTDDGGHYFLAVAPGRFVVTVGVREMRIPGALEPYVHPDKATGEEANVVDMPEEGEVVRDLRLESMPELVAVRGRVVDREGRPVGGAQVGPWGDLNSADGSFETKAWLAHPVWARKSGYGLGTSEPVEAGREVVITLSPAPLLSGRVTAPGGTAVDGAFVLVARDPDPYHAGEKRIAASGGRYEIRDLDPGAYVVRAGATWCAISAPRRVVLEPAGEHALDFVLDAGEAIRGRVVEAETRAPVAGAWVRVQMLRSAASEDQGRRDPAAKGELVVAVSDGEGRFVVENLVPGEYEVRVEARGFVKWSSRASTGGAPADVALEPILAIQGVVTFSDGQPGAGLTVFAKPEDGKSQLFARGVSPEGRFVIRELARGTYRVTAGGSGARTLTSPPVEPGTTDLRLVVERAPPGESEQNPQAQEGDATLEGRIVDPSGKGIGGVRVHAAPMTTTLLGRTTRSGPDGRFVFRGLTAEPHRVRAAFDDQAVATKSAKHDGSLWHVKEDVVPGRDTPSFVFATLGGTIVGEDLDGRELVARVEDVKDGGWRSVVVTRDGSFQIEGLSPGRYDLAFQAMKDRPHLLLEGGEDVEAGRRDVVLRATKGASITGIIVDEAGKPIAGAHVGAATEGSRGGPWMNTRDGRFDLSGLRAGVEYHVSASFADWVTAETRVRAPASNLRIVIEKGFEVRGRLLDADGKPIVNAQVRLVAVGHDAPQRSRQTDSDGRFTVGGLRDGDYRAEMWPKAVKAGDPKPEWQPVGTIRARDGDVELRLK